MNNSKKDASNYKSSEDIHAEFGLYKCAKIALEKGKLIHS
jgi:hypothetical protein